LYFSKALFEGLIFGGAYIRRGLSTEGNLRFKIDWASHIVGSKFTVFALFYFVFEGSFPSTSPRGAYIWRGDLTEGFCVTGFGGLIFGGAYTWRGLFSEFYGTNTPRQSEAALVGECIFQDSGLCGQAFPFLPSPPLCSLFGHLFQQSQRTRAETLAVQSTIKGVLIF